MYGGFQMFDINADCLGRKMFFMRRHSKSLEAMGQMMKQAFETFQIDTWVSTGVYEKLQTP